MSYISQEDRAYIMRKHKEKVYETDTGLSVEEIKKGAGTQFDPEVVKAFLELIDEGAFSEDVPD